MCMYTSTIFCTTIKLLCIHQKPKNEIKIEKLYICACFILVIYMKFQNHTFGPEFSPRDDFWAKAKIPNWFNEQTLCTNQGRKKYTQS